MNHLLCQNAKKSLDQSDQSDQIIQIPYPQIGFCLKSSQIRDQQFLKSRNPKGPSLQPHHFCGFGGFAIFSIC